MSDQVICAIDIGSSKIATLVGIVDKEKESVRVIGYDRVASSGVKKGLIVDIDKASQALEKSIVKAERMSGRKIDRAYVTVGGPHISSLNSHGVVAVSDPEGEITEEDVLRVIEAAKAISLSSNKEMIEILPREYIVNGQGGINNPVGMSGVRLEVETHIITASTTSLRNIERVLSQVGVENLGFVYSALASAEAVLTETERELGVVLVDIGGGKTDMCMFVEGAVAYSASLPIGARNITNDIAVGLRISLSSAERLKLYLSHKYRGKHLFIRSGRKGEKNITEDVIDSTKVGIPERLEGLKLKSFLNDIVLPRYEEIFTLIGEEIEKSGFADRVPSGIVLTGGGSLSAGIEEVGRQVLGMPIRVGYPQKISGLIDEVSTPEYSSLIGLILYVRENIIKEGIEIKNFDRILRNLSFGSYLRKLREFIKQYIPS